MKPERAATIALFICVIGGAVAQNQSTGVTRPYSALQFKTDEDVKCLNYAVEAGDPEKGPSTHILDFPNGCTFPWHYHKAEEQMLVIQGEVSIEMDSAAGAAVLDAGGFAMMASEEPHQFSCKSSKGCRAFVHFDRIYDICWGKKKTTCGSGPVPSESPASAVSPHVAR
jgi:quercetin dioxygenase-like cupin family protein